MLSRSQFHAACEAFIRKYTHSPQHLSAHYTAPLTGWTWAEHSGYGFMTRSSTVSRSRDGTSVFDEEELVEEVVDEQTASLDTFSPVEYLTMQQHVVYSASFQVPAFYFSMHDTYGSPLSLDQILNTSLFKYGVPEQAETTSYALTLPTSSFPLLSQGDHPVLGTPCWYLHPCKSGNAIAELMEELTDGEWTEETRLVRLLEAWFMVLGSTIRLS